MPLTPLQFSLAASTAVSRAQSTLFQLWDKSKAAAAGLTKDTPELSVLGLSATCTEHTLKDG